jgi:hypothetical protein
MRAPREATYEEPMVLGQRQWQVSSLLSLKLLCPSGYLQLCDLAKNHKKIRYEALGNLEVLTCLS